MEARSSLNSEGGDHLLLVDARRQQVCRFISAVLIRHQAPELKAGRLMWESSGH